MGYMFAFMSALCYSIANIVLKKGMAHSKDNGVWIITLINAVVLGIVFITYLLATDVAPIINITGLILFAVSGILINVIGRITLYSGIRQIGSLKAVAIKNSAPVFTLVFAIIIIKEQISLWPWVGISLILLGLLLLGIQYFRQEEKDAQRSGYLVALCAAVGFGLGQGVSKSALFYLSDPFLGVFVSTCAALLCHSAIEAIRGKLIPLITSSFTTHINKHYIWAGFLTSTALLLFYLSASYIHVSYSVAILAADPVLTVILGRFFLKKEENISPMIILVAILVFLGAGIISVMGS
jgi:DME family drug/metabolite transporter